MPIYVQPYKLLIDPSFGTILSGEFRPATDPKQRTHRALRLAQACIAKGNQVEGELAWSYAPSWAPQTTTFSQARGGIGICEITSLAITQQDSYLRIEKTSDKLAQLTGRLVNSQASSLEHIDTTYSLIDDDQLHAATTMTTQYLTDFYRLAASGSAIQSQIQALQKNTRHEKTSE